MTSSTNTGEASAAGDRDAACKNAAAQIRRDNPSWVVIWSACKGEFQARPLFRAKCSMVTARTPEELTARMSAVRLAGRPRLTRS